MPRPAPLVIVVPDLFDLPGGIARISQALVTAAVRWAGARDRRVVVLALNDRGARRDLAVCPASVDYRGFATSRLALTRAVLSLGLGHARAPLVFGHVNLAPLGLAARLRGGRYAIVAHGIDVWLPLSRAKVLALGAARALWPVSHYTAGVLADRGIAPSAIRVIANCIDPRRALVPVAPLPAGPPRFLTVSRLSHDDRDKGVDLTIEAFARADLPDGAALDVVGDGDDRARLEALARGLGAAVTFHGRVPDAAVDALMDAARALVLPSTIEGFGLVFAEAMARGRAVIAARATATPEVVAEGVTGLLVPPGERDERRAALADAIAHLGADPALAERFGTAGRARVEANYLFDRYAAEVAAALDDLVK